MYLCEDSHSEIVHNEGYRDCPLCKALNTIAGLEDKLSELESKLTDTKYEMELLTIELKEKENQK